MVIVNVFIFSNLKRGNCAVRVEDGGNTHFNNHFVSDIKLTMAAVSDPQAAKTIQLTLKELMKTLKKCDGGRKVSEAGLDIVNSQHKEVEAEGCSAWPLPARQSW